MWARRVICSDEEPRPVSVAAPLVGRVEELDLLHNTFARVARDRRAHVFTLYGEPGVGKSRLAREFLEGVEGATILAGRALPYGEGITYWPVAEMVKVSAGITDDEPVAEAVEKLKVCCEDEAIADLLGLASGVLEAVQSESSQQEIAWAVREWSEKLADVQPLVLVFEDIHWAEEPLLELIEHLAAWVREAPLLLLCLARPELLDIRPGWGGGRVRATSIELEPLVPEEVEEMISTLLRRTGLAPEDVVALIEKTGGNPLFVEETIRMLVEEDGDASPERIPDTVQALIAARIDRLDADERRALRRAAVIGRVVLGRARSRTSPRSLDVEPLLESLMLRDFILPESRSSISGETAYRFKHVLIREVAYSGLSKSERADHHLRFAVVAEGAGRRGAARGSCLPPRPRGDAAQGARGRGAAELAAEAAAALEEAGRRARSPATRTVPRARLFLTALELEPTLERRYEAARAAWRITDYPVVSLEMEEVCAAAEAEGNRKIQGRALTALADAAVVRDADVPRAERLIGKALEVLDAEDKVGRVDALEVSATIAWARGDLVAEERVAEEALELAREIGRKDLESEVLDTLASVYIGAMELDRAQPLADRALALAQESRRGRRPRPRSSVPGAALPRTRRLRRGRVPARRGAQVPRGGRRRVGARAHAQLLRLGRLAERRHRARRERCCGSRFASSRRSRTVRRYARSQRSLAQLLVEQGKLDEAERLALEARRTVGPQDLTSLATTAMALGIVRAAQGRDEEAEQLLREAHETVIETDHKRSQLETLFQLHKFLRERGRLDEAQELTSVRARSPKSGSRRRRSQQNRLDRLTRRLVRRLRDQRRRALERRERLGQRLGAQRSLAVGQVLRLVAVRERDVARSGCGTARRARARHPPAPAPRRTSPSR